MCKLLFSMTKLFLVLLLLQAGLAEAAQNQPASASSAAANVAISQSQIETKVAALKAMQGIAEAQKSQLLVSYQTAQENLINTASYVTKTAEYEAALKQAPEKTKKLQREIESVQQKLAKQKLEDFSKITNEELDQRLILEKEKMTALEAQINKLDKALSLHIERPQLIHEETIVAQQDLDTAQSKLELTTAATMGKLESEVQRIQLSTLIEARTAELKMLTVEASSNLARVDLLKTELQLLRLQKDLLDPVVANIENLLNDRRQQDAINMQKALTRAEEKVSGKHSLIQQITRENVEYSKTLQAISAKIEQYNDQKNKAEDTTKQIENDYRSAEKKISLAGLSPVLGKILREQRRNLASQDQLLQESEDVQNETALASLEQFRIDDELESFSDMEQRIKGLMAQVDQALPVDERMMVQAELRVLLNSQKELLNKLSAADTAYLRTLGDFDFANQQLLSEANKFAEYLDERLLWVKSSAPVNADFFRGLFNSSKWLLAPQNWVALIKDTALIAWQNPFLTLITVLISVGLPFVRSWAKRQLVGIAEKIEKIYTDNFSFTLKAFAYTLILVLPLPVLIFMVGWFLSGDSHATGFSKAVGEGLQSIAIPFFVFEFLYRLFAANGMAIRHFQWQKTSANLLRRQIAWLRFVILPGVFLINATSASEQASYSDSLGRLALLVNLTALAVFFIRVLHPSDGLLHSFLERHVENWFSKTRYLWYPLIVAVPLVIAGFALTGYYLSALELQQELIVTLRLIFVIIVIYGMVIRWLTFVNRKLALKNAKQKRITAALNEKQQLASEEGVGVGDDPSLPIDEQLIDIPRINAQTIQLLVVFIGLSMVVGLWMIWRNILPAFSFLENIVLWQYVAKMDNQESLQPITLKNLMMAGLYGFIVVVSVRNFSGVMELFLFSRISIAAGGRYAVNQLAKYLIISIGFLCIASELGGSWSQVQWLVAALSVGLGFGLQEIFANMVSGIILLFERPIRVGDTVTISNVTGKVSRIQMRATTLLDSDHKELVVPNKTFITSQLVNWTLSDTTTRIIFPIYLAYGADVELAHKVMLEAVRATSLVLEEPAPGVVFIGFGIGSMEFSIRAYVSELAHRMPTTHTLHINLEKALVANHIEMPMKNIS